MEEVLETHQMTEEEEITDDPKRYQRCLQLIP